MNKPEKLPWYWWVVIAVGGGILLGIYLPDNISLSSLIIGFLLGSLLTHLNYFNRNKNLLKEKNRLAWTIFWIILIWIFLGIIWLFLL